MQNSFHPHNSREGSDVLAGKLRSIAQTILVTFLGLSPLLILPTPYVSIGSGKVFLLLGGVTIALFFFAMAMLREGNLSFRVPLAVFAVWLVVIASAVSAFMSGDLRDSLLGDSVEGHTVAFILLLALILTSVGILAKSKQALMRLYAMLVVSAILLSLLHGLRLFLGSDSLSLGILNSSTASLLGSWNGLAIFYGLIILLALTAVGQLPLTKAGRYVVVTVAVLSLMMLVLINFSIIWYVLGVTSIVVLFYQLIKNRWTTRQTSDGLERNGDPLTTIVLSIVIALFSIVFALGGAGFGADLADRLGISYVEVRPSLSATVELQKKALNEDVLFGAGPNRFADVWRLYKDPSINQTIFWDTQFDTGYSYILTSVIGSGLVGAAAWIFFLIALLWSAARFLFRTAEDDSFWYFVGLSSLVATLYLWGMSIIYVPPPAIMILAAITTGTFLVAYAQLYRGRSYKLSIARHRNYGLVLIVISILMVSLSGAFLYFVGKQTYAVYQFNKTIALMQDGDSVEKIEQGIAKAFGYSQNDAFSRQIALYRLMQMRAMFSVQSPGEEEQRSFQTAAEQAINTAQLAIALDPSDPRNHQVLGQVYSVLSLVGVEGAADRALETYREAMKFDPHNPVLKYLEAELLLQKEDLSGARASAEAAVAIRRNYSEAIYFLTQLDIQEGNIEQAISRARGVVQLEPQNPARRYQLGVILASLDRLDEAIAYLEQAIALDPQYANARYFLALGYAEKGMTEEAINQLTIVRDLNEANAVVNELIERLENGESVTTPSQDTVSERQADGTVTTKDLESGLVTTPNPVSSTENGGTTNDVNE